MEIINWIIGNWGTVLSGLLMIIGGASIIAKLTPTQADDKIIDAILAILNKFAMNPKKPTARP